MPPVPFGFSVGDVIAVSILIKDVFKALHDSDGASAQYQQLSRELWALDRALLEVELLSRTIDTSTELNALRHSARRVVEQCKECLERFLTKAQKFEISLREGGSGNKLRDAAKKIRWALTQTDELARYRTEINGHSSSLNMLLITASINVTNLTGKSLEARLVDAQHERADMHQKHDDLLTKIHEKLDENRRQLQDQGTVGTRLMERMNFFFKLGSELRTLMLKIWTLNFETYNAVVELQTRIPQKSQPCWIQEPLILTDPLGRVAPIHLELINSWAVFQSVIVARFEELPGHGKISRGEYAIQERNLMRDLDPSLPFESSFLPGGQVDMSIIFKWQDDALTTSCPSCRTESSSAASDSIKCSKCGTWYQRIIDADKPTPTQRATRPIQRRGRPETSSRMSPQPTHLNKRKVDDTEFEEDDIRAFRRIRLLLSKVPIQVPLPVNERTGSSSFPAHEWYSWAITIKDGQGMERSKKVMYDAGSLANLSGFKFASAYKLSEKPLLQHELLTYTTPSEFVTPTHYIELEMKDPKHDINDFVLVQFLLIPTFPEFGLLLGRGFMIQYRTKLGQTQDTHFY